MNDNRPEPRTRKPRKDRSYSDDPVLRALQITITELRELSAEDRKRVLETAEQWYANMPQPAERFDAKTLEKECAK